MAGTQANSKFYGVHFQILDVLISNTPNMKYYNPKIESVPIKERNGMCKI